MEHSNGKSSPTVSESGDYSRGLHTGVTRASLDSLVGEQDEAPENAIDALRKQMIALSTAMATLRGLITEGDGDLHEMQLTSLRRQVSQIEGVLESNYQREIRVAEDRETALRTEMAQMRQDLRVALETLYRMPAETDGSNGGDELKTLETRVTELGESLVKISHDQQRAAVERENTLKSELAHMRRDLLVTLEASYQLPTDRLEGLDAQILSWRGQVEELQSVILGMQSAQDEGATQQRTALQNELRRLGEQIQTTIADSLPQSEHEELVAQRELLLKLEQRIEQRTVDFKNYDERVLRLLHEQGLTLTQDVAAIHGELGVLSQQVAALPTVASDHTAELLTLDNALEALRQEMNAAQQEQHALLDAHGQAVLDGVVASQGVLLEASIALRESMPAASVLTTEAIGELVGTKLSGLQSHWDTAQTVQYRQLISQVSDMQSDLDNVGTAIQAFQLIDTPASDAPELLQEVHALLTALQTREANPGPAAAPVDELNRLRYELQGLRSDLQTALQSQVVGADGGVNPAHNFTLDDVVRVIASQLTAEKAEGDRLAANRDTVLRHELSHIRQEVQSAVQQVQASASNQNTSVLPLDLSQLRAELADLRSGLARIPIERDDTWRNEFAEIRKELNSAVLSVSSSQQQREGTSNETWRRELSDLRREIAVLATASREGETLDESPVVDLVVAFRSELLGAIESMRPSISAVIASPSGSPASEEGFVALAASLQQSTTNQERMVESQQHALQAAMTQMREEMRSALSGLTRESIDTFEQRQSQLRLDQLEMERNLAQLRQELLTTQADPANKKKLWR